MPDALLGPVEIRAIASELGLTPTKRLGQNFVHDPNTVRRIVRTAALRRDDVVLEVGPGVGSLTLGLLAAVASVTAIEIDRRLATALPSTVDRQMPGAAQRLTTVCANAALLSEIPGPQPTALVANLPYNVAVAVLLQLLRTTPTLRRGLVMVQSEVADRLAAEPGSRVYGVPSAKLAWYAHARRAGSVPRAVFWPMPNVDSKLVAFVACDPPRQAKRADTFAVIDAAFGRRRKMMRSALAELAGSADHAASALRTAGIDPTRRAESLGIGEFAAIAAVLASTHD